MNFRRRGPNIKTTGRTLLSGTGGREAVGNVAIPEEGSEEVSSEVRSVGGRGEASNGGVDSPGRGEDSNGGVVSRVEASSVAFGGGVVDSIPRACWSSISARRLKASGRRVLEFTCNTIFSTISSLTIDSFTSFLAHSLFRVKTSKVREGWEGSEGVDC